MTSLWRGGWETGSAIWRRASSLSSGPGRRPTAPAIRSWRDSWPATRRKRMQREPGSGKAVRVGLVILAAFAALAVGIFLIGDKNNMFRSKNRYYIEFNSVSGVKPGSPVQLNGVDVGTVEEVTLPQEPTERHIQVWIKVDARYADLIRGGTKIGRAHVSTPVTAT